MYSNMDSNLNSTITNLFNINNRVRPGQLNSNNAYSNNAYNAVTVSSPVYQVEAHLSLQQDAEALAQVAFY